LNGKAGTENIEQFFMQACKKFLMEKFTRMIKAAVAKIKKLFICLPTGQSGSFTAIAE
jgi:hypothetical protein